VVDDSLIGSCAGVGGIRVLQPPPSEIGATRRVLVSSWPMMTQQRDEMTRYRGLTRWAPGRECAQQANEMHKLQTELQSATVALETASKSLEETRTECDHKTEDVRQLQAVLEQAHAEIGQLRQEIESLQAQRAEADQRHAQVRALVRGRGAHGWRMSLAGAAQQGRRCFPASLARQACCRSRPQRQADTGGILPLVWLAGTRAARAGAR